jgi:hypothetical protein
MRGNCREMNQMLQNSISRVFSWACLLMLFATTPSLAEGGDAGEIASQIIGPSLGHDLGPGLGETPPEAPLGRTNSCKSSTDHTRCLPERVFNRFKRLIRTSG